MSPVGYCKPEPCYDQMPPNNRKLSTFTTKNANIFVLQLQSKNTNSVDRIFVDTLYSSGASIHQINECINNAVENHHCVDNCVHVSRRF